VVARDVGRFDELRLCGVCDFGLNVLYIWLKGIVHGIRCLRAFGLSAACSRRHSGSIRLRVYVLSESAVVRAER